MTIGADMAQCIRSCKCLRCGDGVDTYFDDVEYGISTSSNLETVQISGVVPDETRQMEDGDERYTTEWITYLIMVNISTF